MKYLLRNRKLIFLFRNSYVSCFTIIYYQINGILSFAVLDLVYKIIKQRDRKYIILKKRKPIIYMLNYIDALNFNSSKFGITFFFKNKYEIQLARGMHYYRSKHFKFFNHESLNDCLKVIEHENSCTIRFDDYDIRLQTQNVNFVAMVMHILDKEKNAFERKIDTINVSGILFYCLFLT